MLNYYSILLNKRALLLYIKGRTKPIAIETYPSIYSSLLVQKLKKAPLSIKDIVLNTEQQQQIGSGSFSERQGNRWYLTSSGKIEESEKIEDDKFLLARASHSFGEGEVQGIQTRSQYLISLTAKILILFFGVEAFKVLYTETRVENLKMDHTEYKRL